MSKYVAVLCLGLLGLTGIAEALPVTMSNGVWSGSMVRDCRSPGNTSLLPDRCIGTATDPGAFNGTRRQWVELSQPGGTDAETSVTNPLGILNGQATGARVVNEPGSLNPPSMHHGAFTSTTYARTSGNLLSVQGYAWDGTGASHRSLDLALDYTGTNVVADWNALEQTDSTDAASSIHLYVQIFALDSIDFLIDTDPAAAGACHLDFNLTECLASTRADFEMLSDIELRAETDAGVLSGQLEFDLAPGRFFFVYMQTQALARFGAYMDATHSLHAFFDNAEGLVAAPDGITAVPEPGAWTLLLAGLVALRRRARAA